MYIGILLAAGRSSRMGQPKGLLEWRGHPLIAHQIIQMKKSGLSQIIVVLGHESEQYEPHLSFGDFPVRMVHNENWQDGKSSSIRKGLSMIQGPCEAVLFVNVDQPVTASILESLLESFVQNRSFIHIPVYHGKRGHPVLFSSRLLPALQEVKEETQGLKNIIRNHVEHVTEVKIEDDSILFNFNTIQDYQGRSTD